MNITIFSFIIVLILLAVVFEAIRRGYLETNYAILWIATLALLSLLSIFEGLLDKLAALFNVDYAPSLLFLFGLLFTLIIIFDLTRRISKLNHRLIALTQEYTLLKREIEDLTEELHK